MSMEITVALISLVGVVFSILVSLIAGRRVANIEMQKLRLEIQQTYASKLIERRLEVYPEITSLLSKLVKTIRFTSLTQETFQEFRNQFEELDTNYSVLFSAKTGIIFHKFHNTMVEISKLSDSDIRKKFDSEIEIEKFQRQIGKVELALKNDLGIYVVEFSDPNKSFEDYDEISIAVTKPAK
jgi:hypothetical protein